VDVFTDSSDDEDIHSNEWLTPAYCRSLSGIRLGYIQSEAFYPPTPVPAGIDELRHAEMIDLMLRVCNGFRWGTMTFIIAVDIFNRTQGLLEEVTDTLLASTCVWLACKLEERYMQAIELIGPFSGFRHVLKEYEDTEVMIANELVFDFYTPNPLIALQRERCDAEWSPCHWRVVYSLRIIQHEPAWDVAECDGPGLFIDCRFRIGPGGDVD
jgi:hypothetical protein